MGGFTTSYNFGFGTIFGFSLGDTRFICTLAVWLQLDKSF